MSEASIPVLYEKKRNAVVVLHAMRFVHDLLLVW